MTQNSRHEQYRYLVTEELSEITPLALIQAYVGNTQVKVLNVSMGGVALAMEPDFDCQAGDLIDVSIAIRERAFPMQIEVKNYRRENQSLNASFINPPPAFMGALREFLGPKFLGASLQHLPDQNDFKAALDLVEDSHFYRVYTGQNQSGVFIWADANKKLLRLLAVSRELVMSWDIKHGVRTGRLKTSGAKSMEDVSWDRVLEYTVFHYISDILLAWRSQPTDREWLEKLLSSNTGAHSENDNSLHIPFGDF